MISSNIRYTLCFQNNSQYMEPNVVLSALTPFILCFSFFSLEWLTKHLNKSSAEMISDLIPSLPNDIALVVLVGVPCQFHSVLKSVCKSWNSLFSDPSFYTLCKLGWQERRSYLHGPDTDVPPRCKPLQRHPQNLAKTASSYSVTPFQKANLPLQSDAFGSKTVIIDHWSGTNIICMFDFRHPGKERHIFSKVREILPDHYTDPFKGGPACQPRNALERGSSIQVHPSG